MVSQVLAASDSKVVRVRYRTLGMWYAYIIYIVQHGTVASPPLSSRNGLASREGNCCSLSWVLGFCSDPNNQYIKTKFWQTLIGSFRFYRQTANDFTLFLKVLVGPAVGRSLFKSVFVQQAIFKEKQQNLLSFGSVLYCCLCSLLQREVLVCSRFSSTGSVAFIVHTACSV